MNSSLVIHSKMNCRIISARSCGDMIHIFVGTGAVRPISAQELCRAEGAFRIVRGRPIWGTGCSLRAALEVSEDRPCLYSTARRGPVVGKFLEFRARGKAGQRS